MKTKILLGASTILMLAALYMVFIFAPDTEPGLETNVVQRIFYFHVPLAWIAFLAFFVVFIASIMYLRKRNKKWDDIASTSAEIGLVFTTLFLITGSIWAKPEWGVWWTWDSRLTSSLILWLIYIAYFVIRSYISEEGQRARFSSVIGIIGFIDVPIVVITIFLWRTTHPQIEAMDPRVTATLMISIATFTAVYLLLFAQRLAMKQDEDELNGLKALLRR
ncbi:MAG: cytochrome c biogenesis protein [Chloroflexota bacterium]